MQIMLSFTHTQSASGPTIPPGLQRKYVPIPHQQPPLTSKVRSPVCHSRTVDGSFSITSHICSFLQKSRDDVTVSAFLKLPVFTVRCRKNPIH